MELKVLKEIVEIRVIKVLQANEDLWERLGIKVYRVYEDIRVFKDIKAKRV
jgi:hypothetical protein